MEVIKVRRNQGLYDTYLKLLIQMRSDICWFFNESDQGKQAMVPFVLTMSAALECSLNDHLNVHFDTQYDRYGKQLLSGLKSMNFKGFLNLHEYFCLTQN